MSVTLALIKVELFFRSKIKRMRCRSSSGRELTRWSTKWRSTLKRGEMVELTIGVYQTSRWGSLWDGESLAEFTSPARSQHTTLSLLRPFSSLKSSRAGRPIRFYFIFYLYISYIYPFVLCYQIWLSTSSY